LLAVPTFQGGSHVNVWLKSPSHEVSDRPKSRDAPRRKYFHDLMI
jgi:hypothetical protein